MPESRETIGQKLRQLRLSRKITIEQAADATRIRVQYLQALEADNYSAMASTAQGRGFLRSYAGYLGLDLEAAMQELRESGAEIGTNEPAEAVYESPVPVPPQPAPTPAPEEKPAAKPFWTRLLKKSAPKPSQAVELPVEEIAEKPAEVPPEPVQVLELPKKPASQTPDKKKRVKKIAVDERDSQPDTQVETPAELEVTQPHESAEEPEVARPGLLARLTSVFRIRLTKAETPEDNEPALAESDESETDLVEAEVSSGTPREKSSKILFAELGAQLRERREALNLTREEIERHIHLRAHYMLALEQGEISGLPTAVQTRGMLNNYASFLNLDVDAILLRYADVLQVRHREQHPLPPGARGRPAPSAPATLPPLRGFVVADMMAIGLVLLLVVFSVWGVQFVIQKGAQAKPSPPAKIDILLEATPLPAGGILIPTSGLLDLEGITPTLQPLETPLGLPEIPEGISVLLNIIAIERTYLRVIVDGEVAFEGRVTPGTAYPFEAESEIEVLAGNGAALRIVYNQRDVGLLGKYGEVVDLIYLGNEVVTPTPTIGPSPTVSSTATKAPTVTPSSTPTRTPVP
jgi:cytoskeletal protein RodZ